MQEVLNQIKELVNSPGSHLVIGALLAGVVGYVFVIYERKQNQRRTREGWGAILYDQIYTQGPSGDPIGTDPPTIMLLNYSALDHIFQPGVLDAQKESALLNLLVFFDSVVKNYNYKAQVYNSAWANGVERSILDKCRIDFYMSNMDYKEQHDNVRNQMWELYVPGEKTIYAKEQRAREHNQKIAEEYYKDQGQSASETNQFPSASQPSE